MEDKSGSSRRAKAAGGQLDVPNATAPVVIALEAKRLAGYESSPAGQVSANFATELGLSEDDPKTVKAVISIDAKGIGANSQEAVFEIKYKMACRFVFKAPRKKEDLDDSNFASTLTTPLYHRAAVQLEELARNMGYPAVRLPLMPPVTTPVVEKTLKKRVRKPREAKEENQPI